MISEREKGDVFYAQDVEAPTEISVEGSVKTGKDPKIHASK